jgi:hypothetical protein
MTRTTWITAAALALIVAAIVVALLMEAASGPTFRAEDYASYDECIRNIPAEWGRGTLQRDGAEEACFFVHRRGR